jgi:hypothetical protein
MRHPRGDSSRSPGSHHAVEADNVALGILEDSDEAVRRDVHARLHNGAAVLRDALQHAVEVPFDIEVDDRAAGAGLALVHLCQGSAHTLVGIDGEHGHVVLVIGDQGQRLGEDLAVEVRGLVDVVGVDFEPVERVLFHRDIWVG